MTIHFLQTSLRQHRRTPGSESEVSLQLSEEDASFCSRFDLPTSEAPFPDWQGGRRCSLMDRERPLMGSKGGRLFLTYSFLCFERSSKARDPDRMVVPLTDVTAIVKVRFSKSHKGLFEKCICKIQQLIGPSETP